MPRINQERAYAFLHERNGAVFGIPEMAAAAGWSESTVKTYTTKHWQPWLTRVGTGTYRVSGFESVSLGDFMSRQSQVKSDAPEELQDGTPESHDLSDSEWAELTKNLRNESTVVSDTRTLLRRIVDDLNNPPNIRRDAQAADTLLETIAEFIEGRNPLDEPVARASVPWLRAYARRILREVAEHPASVVDLAVRVLQALG